MKWWRQWWWKRRRADMPIGPTIDLAAADRKMREAEAKLKETKELVRETHRELHKARVVEARVDRFTREVEQSYRRLRHGHG